MSGDEREDSVEAVSSDDALDESAEGLEISEDSIEVVAPEAPRARKNVSIPPPVPEGARRSAASIPPPVPGRAPRPSQIPPLPPVSLEPSSPSVVEERKASLPIPRDVAIEDLTALAKDADKDCQPTLAHALGVLALEAEDDALAGRAFGQALKQASSFRANLWSVRSVFRARGKWENLAKLVAAEAGLVSDDADAAELWVEHGEILETQLEDSEGAAQSFEKALLADDECLGALFGLERVATKRGDSVALAEVFEKLAARVEQPERRAAYLGDAARLRQDTDPSAALSLLSRAGELGVFPAYHARWRESLASGMESPEAVAAAIRDQLASEQARERDAGDAEQARCHRRRQVALLLGLADVLESELSDSEAAWESRLRALAIEETVVLGARELFAAADKLSRYDELAAAVADRVRGGRCEELTRLAHQEALRLIASGRSGDAQALLAPWVQHTPDDPRVLLLREWMALEGDDVAAISRVWSELAASACFSADAEGAAALSVAAGDALALTGDHEGSAVHYRAALDRVPDDSAAVLALASAYERLERVSAAKDVLAAHADKAADPKVFWARLSALLHRDEEWEPLGDLLAKWVARDEGDAHLRRWHIGVLAALGRTKDRVEALLALAEKVPEDEALWCKGEAARLLDTELGDTASAEPLYHEVLEARPDDGVVRAALAAVYRENENWDGLVDFLEAQLSRTPERVPSLVRELGAVLSTQKGQPQRAAELFERHAEEHPALWRDAVTARRQAALAGGDVDAWMAAAKKWSETDGPRARLELAMAQTRAGQWTAAGEAFSSAAKDGSALGAVALVECGKASQDADAVVRGLSLLARQDDSDDAGSLWEAAGWSALWHGGDARVAASCFSRAGSTSAAALGSYLAAAKDGEALDVQEALVAFGDQVDDDTWAAAAVQRAALFAVANGQREHAERLLSRALAMPQTDGEVGFLVCDWLGAAVVSPESAPSEAALLAYAEACGARARTASEDEDVRAWELEQAGALLRAGRGKSAQALVLALVKRDPTDAQALALLRRTSEARNDRLGQARAAGALAACVEDRQNQLSLLREAVAILDEELSLADECVPLYRRILELDPEAPEFARVKDILRERGDVGGSLALCTARLQLELSPEQRARVLLVRAEMRRQFGDVIGANEDLQGAREAAPEEPGVLWEVASLALERRDEQGAIDVLRQYTNVTEGEQREKGLLRIADLLAGQGEPAKAAEELLRGTEGSSPRFRDRLIEYLVESGRNDEAVRQSLAKRDTRECDDDKIADEMALGALCRDKLADPLKAGQAFVRAFRIDKSNPEPVLALEELAPPRVDLGVVWEEHAAELRVDIEDDPSEAAYYESLARCAPALGQERSGAFATVAATLLGGTEPVQVDMPALGPVSARLSDDCWKKWLVGPDDDPTFREVFGLLSEAVDRLRMGDPSRAGISAKRYKPRDVEKVFPMVAEAQMAFGVEAFELHVADAPLAAPFVTTGKKPRVYMAQGMLEAGDAEARYWLGRAMAQLYRGSGALLSLAQDDVGKVVVAGGAVAGVDVEPALVGLSADELAEHKARLERELSRKERKQVQAAMGKFGNIGAPRWAWSRERRVAARAGLLWCGDLAVALGCEFAGATREALAKDPDALSLMSWAISEAYLGLAEGLGWGER